MLIDTIKVMKVVLIFGGESPEHDVSISSAMNIFAALDKEKYNTQLVYIDKKGIWYAVDKVRKALKEDEVVSLIPGKQTICIGERIYRPDVLFPVLHGSNGEDGTIQGLAKLLHIPIVGPSLLSATVSMDKDITKKLLTASDLPVVDWVVLHKSPQYPNYEVLKAHLGEKLFIKPASAGSSVGVSKAKDEVSYQAAVEQAFLYDDKIIIETAINGAREIEIAVLGNRESKASQAGEIIPGAEFYSYQDKYDNSSKAQVKIPADLDKEIADDLHRLALRAYDVIEGRGMARIDFFLAEGNKIYINEINTIPGFTNISMYPKLWEQENIHYSSLIDKLIQYALKE